MKVKENILAEVEPKTQSSRPRPRTQKQSEAKDRPSRANDRNARGQGHDAKVFKKKGLHKFTARSLARSPRRRKKKVMTLAHFLQIKKYCCPDRAFLRTCRLGQGLTFKAKAKDFKMCSRGLRRGLHAVA